MIWCERRVCRWCGGGGSGGGDEEDVLVGGGVCEGGIVEVFPLGHGYVFSIGGPGAFPKFPIPYAENNAIGRAQGLEEDGSVGIEGGGATSLEGACGVIINAVEEGGEGEEFLFDDIA